MEDHDFHKRRTKSLKKKQTYEIHGQYSTKHLRICEELKLKRVKNVSK